MFGEVMIMAAQYENTQYKSQLGQGLPNEKKSKKSVRTNLLNRLKMRMLSALKGEQYR
jgi:hypothetical protein